MPRAASASSRSTTRASTRSSGRARSAARASRRSWRDVGEGERRAVVGEALRDGRAEAAGGAGDGEDAAVEAGADAVAPARVSTSSSFGLTTRSWEAIHWANFEPSMPE